MLRTVYKIVGIMFYIITTYLVIHLLYMNYKHMNDSLEYYEKIIFENAKETAITNDLIRENHELLMIRRALSEVILQKTDRLEKRLDSCLGGLKPNGK